MISNIINIITTVAILLVTFALISVLFPTIPWIVSLIVSGSVAYFKDCIVNMAKIPLQIYH